ncbi:MAG: hypothetical protein LBH13_00650 [Cellulomonadaceae bacterium]|nr:hypothetical protein [Cellulomonadaceae bacterium]
MFVAKGSLGESLSFPVGEGSRSVVACQHRFHLVGWKLVLVLAVGNVSSPQ